MAYTLSIEEQAAITTVARELMTQSTITDAIQDNISESMAEAAGICISEAVDADCSDAAQEAAIEFSMDALWTEFFTQKQLVDSDLIKRANDAVDAVDGILQFVNDTNDDPMWDELGLMEANSAIAKLRDLLASRKR